MYADNVTSTDPKQLLATHYRWQADDSSFKQGLLLFTFDLGASGEQYQALTIIEDFKNDDFGLQLYNYEGIISGTDGDDNQQGDNPGNNPPGNNGNDPYPGSDDQEFRGYDGDDAIDGGKGN
ncbi:MAG: hypothetical protein GY761_07950, partial [Hyphomicrobiales bacterium]|nr:hypothetical protein [Hyphomicrobiales bacterium]